MTSRLPKIHRTKQERFRYYVRFYDRAGRRHRVFFKSKTAAEKKLNELNKTFHAEGADGAMFGANDRAEYAAARQVLLDSGISILEACKCYVREHPPCREATPFVAAVEEFLKEKRNLGRADRTVDELRRILTAFALFSDVVLCGDVSREKIVHFAFQENFGTGRKINTLAVVREWCRWSIKPRNLYLRADVSADIERPTRKAKAPVALLPEEALRCLDFADKCGVPAFRLYVSIALLAGLRQSEILALPRMALDGAARTGSLAVVGIGKRGMSRREVPIGERLRAAIRATPGILPQWNEAIWNKMKTAAGAEKKWCQDILRHTWTSHRLALSGDANRTAMEGGHDRATMSGFYVDPRTPEQAKKLFSALAENEGWAVEAPNKPVNGLPVASAVTVPPPA